MVMTWFSGVFGLSSGFWIASSLRSGTLPDLASAVQHAGTIEDVLESARLHVRFAMMEHARVMFPLSVAQVILSALLVIASGLAMGGRRGSRGLALQAVVSNAGLAVLTFALTPFLRAASAAGALKVSAGVALAPVQQLLLTSAGIEWVQRGRLAMEVGVLALGALALTRARTKHWFEAVARTESREEEEEP